MLCKIKNEDNVKTDETKGVERKGICQGSEHGVGGREMGEGVTA